MVRHQVVERRGKPAFVKIDLKDWRRLVRRIEALEDRADVRAFDRAKRSLGEVIPASVVNEALDKNPLRAFRRWRGQTQAALAKKAGVTPIYVSMIESGRKNGSIAVMRSFADILGVDLDLIVGRRRRLPKS